MDNVKIGSRTNKRLIISIFVITITSIAINFCASISEDMVPT